MPSPLRACALAVGLSLAQAGAIVAQEQTLPEPAEARQILEKACRDEGSDAAQCSCLGGFVQTNFTAREIAGAALVFGNPLYVTDPSAGIAALLAAGFSLDEVTGVAERVMSLEEEASAACATEAAASEEN
jgi:hypothetical protein